MHNPLSYFDANQERYLTELKDFLRIPSVSTQPEHNSDVVRAAEWVADKLQRAGLEHVQVIKTALHPLVYADWLHAGPDALTVLIYGHYDVQPAEPFAEWHSPPFEPQVRDNFLYARGASDDKGQFYVHVKAVEAYLQSDGRLPLNVKFIIEGEEECGGKSLSAFIPAHKELLAADVALVSDTAIVDPQQPAIVYGLRGMAYMLLDITGPRRDLHSGTFGGGVNNPLNVIGHIIAKLIDEEGHILIPGFYDRVRPLTESERDILAHFPFDQAAWEAETGVPKAWGEAQYSLIERLGARPTLDVNGLIGGYTGPGAKTVLPSTVHAKISMRLVPDQDYVEIAELFTHYVQEITPPSVKVTIKLQHGADATMTNYNTPAMKAASAAYGRVFEHKPVYMREGGSIPVVSDFKKHLGLETVLMGLGLPSDCLHAPNERFYLPNFYRGIQTSIHFFAELAGR